MQGRYALLNQRAELILQATVHLYSNIQVN